MGLYDRYKFVDSPYVSTYAGLPIKEIADTSERLNKRYDAAVLEEDKLTTLLSTAKASGLVQGDMTKMDIAKKNAKDRMIGRVNEGDYENLGRAIKTDTFKFINDVTPLVENKAAIDAYMKKIDDTKDLTLEDRQNLKARPFIGYGGVNIDPLTGAVTNQFKGREIATIVDINKPFLEALAIMAKNAPESHTKSTFVGELGRLHTVEDYTKLLGKDAIAEAYRGVVATTPGASDYLKQKAEWQTTPGKPNINSFSYDPTTTEFKKFAEDKRVAYLKEGKKLTVEEATQLTIQDAEQSGLVSKKVAEGLKPTQQEYLERNAAYEDIINQGIRYGQSIGTVNQQKHFNMFEFGEGGKEKSRLKAADEYASDIASLNAQRANPYAGDLAKFQGQIDPTTGNLVKKPLATYMEHIMTTSPFLTKIIENIDKDLADAPALSTTTLALKMFKTGVIANEVLTRVITGAFGYRDDVKASKEEIKVVSESLAGVFKEVPSKFWKKDYPNMSATEKKTWLRTNVKVAYENIHNVASYTPGEIPFVGKMREWVQKDLENTQILKMNSYKKEGDDLEISKADVPLATILEVNYGISDYQEAVKKGVIIAGGRTSASDIEHPNALILNVQTDDGLKTVYVNDGKQLNESEQVRNDFARDYYSLTSTEGKENSSSGVITTKASRDTKAVFDDVTNKMRYNDSPDLPPSVTTEYSDTKGKYLGKMWQYMKDDKIYTRKYNSEGKEVSDFNF